MPARPKYPARGNSEAPTHARRSLLPLIAGRAKAASHRQIFWEHEGNRAHPQRTWKLVRKYPGEWELYDMVGDRTELRNVASAQPKLVREMAGDWEKWASANGVLPWAEVSKELVDR